VAAKKGLLRVVRKVCLWCQGKSWPMVQACTQTECSLHGWRLLDQAEDVQVLAALHTFCIQCAGSAEAAQGCTADQGIGGHDPCPAHPFRTGKITALIQKVRPLPGLHLGQETQQQYFPGPSAQQAEPLAPSEVLVEEEAIATTHRVVQLPFLLPERIPEALDI